jgi:leader peptidase (prepilin peptidase) / N-methyltransferase
MPQLAEFFAFATLPRDAIFWGIVLFLLGLCIGSFLNACIYRVPRGISLSRPRRSFCFSCKTPIAWYDNLPLISYIALRGRCRRCGVSYSIRYFFVELSTGLLFTMGLLFFGGDVVPLLVYLVLVSVLTVIFLIDVDRKIIPDQLSLTGIPLGLLLSVVVWLVPLSGRFPVQTPLEALLGIATGYLILWVIRWGGSIAFRKEAMGMGDLKLLAMLGGFIGWESALYTVVLSSFLGAIVGVSGKIIDKLMRREGAGALSEIPYGPFLSIAGLFCFIYNDAMHSLFVFHVLQGGL